MFSKCLVTRNPPFPGRLTSRGLIACLAWVALGAILSLSAGAEYRAPVVAVDVVLAETAYQRHFGDEVAAVEADLADTIARTLEECLPFLEFVAMVGTREGAKVGEAQLHVRIGREGGEPLRKVEIHLELVDERLITAPATDTLLFRSLEDSINTIGSRERFVEEVRVVMSRRSKNQWLDPLFSKVALVEEANARTATGEWYWILPFGLDEIGAFDYSQFLVRPRLDGGGGTGLHLVEADPHAPPDLGAEGTLTRVLDPGAAETLEHATEREAEAVSVVYHLDSWEDYRQILVQRALEAVGGRR